MHVTGESLIAARRSIRRAITDVTITVLAHLLLSRPHFRLVEARKNQCIRFLEVKSDLFISPGRGFLNSLRNVCESREGVISCAQI